MFRFFGVGFATLIRLSCSQKSLLLEYLALRQQLSVLKRRHPRPRLDFIDRLFWLLARRCWSGWRQALLVVTPETVVRWHRAGFRWYWKLISKVRKPTGRTPIAREVRDLIFQMVAAFGVLYCFFVISHERRRILHFNITKHPTSLWIVQQLREAFPFDSTSRFLLFDRDAKYGLEVPVAVRSLSIHPVRTSFESPWQNGKLPPRPAESCHRAQ